ncbi:MAG: XRE family transcriptional regulator [Flavobacterium sp.]|nr:MAG: XRE family transcriptional regulator [Flavobacterium sp.]
MENLKNASQVVGNNIKAFRARIGLTQEAMAEYLATSREQVAYYENGSRTVSSEHLAKMADLFCVNEYDFFEADTAQKTVNMALAFRAEELQAVDLVSIAKFKKIVRNYLNMKKALANG